MILLSFLIVIESFALSLPVSANSELKTDKPETTQRPETVIPEILHFIQADPDIDDHVMNDYLDNLAEKEKVNDKGENVNFADFNLNLKAAKDSLETNELLLFHLMKQAARALINGIFNHAYDTIRSFFQSPVASFVPDLKKTSVFDFILWLIYKITIFGLVLRLMIFCTPFRPLRAILLRIEYWTMCL